MTRREEIKQLAAARAKESASRCGIGDPVHEARQILTSEEHDQVYKLWMSMDGSACWADAYREWIKLPEATP